MDSSVKDNSSNKRRFGIYSVRSDEAVKEAVEHTSSCLLKAGIETVYFSDIANNNWDKEHVEGVISLGGDGSLLHAARFASPRQIPVVGINFGKVGYLCAVNEQGLDLALDRIVNKQYKIEKRSMLKGKIFKNGKLVWEDIALNEFLVGACTRTVNLEVFIDGDNFGKIRGDGVIITTKTGSTAYAFSAGGPVLLVDALCLVASNAVFSSAIRSVVLPLTSKIRIVNLTVMAKPYVVTDGQKDIQIEANTEMEFSISPIPALMLNLGLMSPVETLHRGFQEGLIREIG